MVGGGFHSIKHKCSRPQHWESYALCTCAQLRRKLPALPRCLFWLRRSSRYKIRLCHDNGWSWKVEISGIELRRHWGSTVYFLFSYFLVCQCWFL